MSMTNKTYTYEFSAITETIPMVFTNSTENANVTGSPAPMDKRNQVHVSYPVMVSLWIMSALIIIGNGLVCAAFIYNRRLRTITNHFVLSLAVSDILVGAVLIPFYIWKSEDTQVVAPMISFILIASIANICGCTYDRYIAIEQPLRYKSILTKRRIAIILTVVWTIPVLLAPIPKIWEIDGKKLGFNESSVMLATKIYIGFITFAILFFCILLASVYVNLFRVARRHMAAMKYLQKFHQRETEKKETTKGTSMSRRRFSVRFLVQEVRATKLFAIVGLVFAVCWFPLVYMNFSDVFNLQGMYNQEFQTVAMYTTFGNSLINPIIYAFFQKLFRLTIIGWFDQLTGFCSREKDTDANKKKARQKRSSEFELVFKEENGRAVKTVLPDVSELNANDKNSFSNFTESKV